MKTKILFAVSIFLSTTLISQTATAIVDLETPILDESSGLLFYNNKAITFMDSEGDAKLFEVDEVSGNVTRTVSISNATNTDWEDIAQDNNYIYIGDFGNNDGIRTDLKIYKISKVDYDSSNDEATAEIINFSYEDQVDFSVNASTNFDAEGLISYGNHLLIFSKNWGNNMVKVYSIPKSPGSHSAILEGSYNTNGMITGADINENEEVIFLTGYSSSSAPFMYTIQNIPNNTLNVFSGTVSGKITDIVPFGNIIEGVALFETTTTKFRIYLTNERFIANAGPISVTFPAKLWLIEIEDESLNTENQKLELDVNIFPNPFSSQIYINQKVDEIKVYDAFGKLIITQINVDEISLKNINNGIYFAHLK